MAKITRLTAELSVDSIDKLIKDIQAWRDDLNAKNARFIQLLAEAGGREAAHRFLSADSPDNNTNIDVVVEGGGNVWRVVAKDLNEEVSKNICFIEFGAGVYHNGSEPYPEARPPQVLRIGEYGKGRGKQNTWVYERDGEKVYTHGTPAAMPMYYSKEEIRRVIYAIAAEVFG